MNRELPDVQAGFRKGRGTREQFANIHWFIEKQASSRTTSLLTMLKPLTVWITTNCGEFCGEKSLVGYNPRGIKESDTTE